MGRPPSGGPAFERAAQWGDVCPWVAENWQAGRIDLLPILL